MITLEQAKKLKIGQILFHTIHKNADNKTAQRWRVNGLVKTWKTRPNEIRIPVKHGYYDYDYITQNDLDLVSLQENL